MCGFFISNFQLDDYQVRLECEKSLKFRGPDFNSDLIHNGNWTAIHYRLSIIDLTSESNQPILNDKNMLVYNGEIFNFKKLGFKYFNKLYSSDTLLLYDLLINEVFNADEIDGFFSFVFIDNNGNLKYAIRDKFGVKPLYYFTDGIHHAFSSEPSLLKNLFNLPSSQDALLEYKAFRYPIFSGSYFLSINQVDAGSCLINGSYFNLLSQLESNQQILFNCDSYIATQSEISASIASRSVSDVKMGILLSGGVDSNLIRLLSNNNRCFAIGYGSEDEDLQRIEQLNIKNSLIYRISKEEFIHNFEYLLALRQEPLSVPNEVMLYSISKIAKSEGVKVLLSGEGADEFFGGYDRIYRWSLHNSFDINHFINLYCYSQVDLDSTLFQKIFCIFNEIKHLHPFLQVKYFMIKYHLPVLFRRLDFSLMAAGVEGREPLSSYNLFINSLKYFPSDLISDDQGKIPLRSILSTFTSDSFAFLKKIGFEVNLKDIFSISNNSINNYDFWREINLKVLS